MKKTGGTAVIIDYGHMVTGLGDTLQAELRHEFDPPLAHPGRSGPDEPCGFEDLARIARGVGIQLNG